MLTPAQKQHSGHRTVGFRKGISTEDAAFRLTDSVLKSINQKKSLVGGIGGIFCDLAKTFDCVNHEML